MAQVLEKFLQHPEKANKIFFVLADVYKPENNKIFYNIDSAKQEILSSSKNEYEYKLRVFLLSFALFFLEHLHSYFLDLLKNKKSLKVQMYRFEMAAKGFFEIAYDIISITKENFADNTKIIPDQWERIISMDKEVEKIIKRYLSYINEITNNNFDIPTSFDNNFVLPTRPGEWSMLYYVLYNVALSVYT